MARVDVVIELPIRDGNQYQDDHEERNGRVIELPIRDGNRYQKRSRTKLIASY